MAKKTFVKLDRFMKTNYGGSYKDLYSFYEVPTDKITNSGNIVVYLYILNHNYVDSVPDLIGRHFGVMTRHGNYYLDKNY